MSVSAKTLMMAAVLGLSAVGRASAAGAVDLSKVPASDWIDIFNGKDLDGWVPKVVGTAAGQDPLKTFYVKDGLLLVDYANYGGSFNNRYGHLSYEKRKFSYYLIHAETNPWGVKQPAGSPDWACQNNGLLYHSQSMESMSINQSYPTSIEFQILGSLNHLNSDTKTENGTTANLCSAALGTSMIVNGSRVSPGCLNAKHVKIDTSHFQVLEALILGDSLVKHMVAGDTGKALDTVLTYSKLQQGSKPLTEGYLTIQSESAPYKFRKIRILDLAGCTDTKYSSYRSYFLKSDPSKCSNAVGLNGAAGPAGFRMELRSGILRLTLPAGKAQRVRVLDPAGHSVLPEREANGPSADIPVSGLRPGIYFCEAASGGVVRRGKFAVMGSF